MTHGLLRIEVSRSHSDTPHSSRIPLDQWSARRRDLYLTTQKHSQEITSMPLAGFEPAIPTSKTLDRAVALIGCNNKSSPVTGLEWPRVFQEVKVPRFHDNGTGW